jgi:hypothetical protein
VWFRRGRLVMVSPDSLGTACPLSGRNSTYRLVLILEAGSEQCAKRVNSQENIWQFLLRRRGYRSNQVQGRT